MENLFIILLYFHLFKTVKGSDDPLTEFLNDENYPDEQFVLTEEQINFIETNFTIESQNESFNSDFPPAYSENELVDYIISIEQNAFTMDLGDTDTQLEPMDIPMETNDSNEELPTPPTDDNEELANKIPAFEIQYIQN